MADSTSGSSGASRRVLIAGASGLVGRELLALLLDDPGVAHVVAIGRRAPATPHSKLESLAVDFAKLPPLPDVDDVYIALGTTIKSAGSQDAFRAVDQHAVLATARAARAARASRLGLVSAMGADARSRVFYSRVKGEVEEALSAMGFATFVCARPSVLVGDRTALAQPERPGEHLAKRVSDLLGPLVPANYRAIPARDVARALHAAVQRGTPGRQVLLSGAMRSK